MRRITALVAGLALSIAVSGCSRPTGIAAAADALGAAKLISSRSEVVREERVVASMYTASSSEVLPEALSPCSTLTPGDNSRSSRR